jgi:hypothetical protein
LREGSVGCDSGAFREDGLLGESRKFLDVAQIVCGCETCVIGGSDLGRYLPAEQEGDCHEQ